MQTYWGIKTINARPQEKDGKPGYEVQYPDGYKSWSPKDVFEEAYFTDDTREAQAIASLYRVLHKEDE